MDNSPLNSAMAKLVERLTDRILPDESVPERITDKDESLRERWASFIKSKYRNYIYTFLGTGVWATVALLHLHFFDRSKSSQPDQSAGDSARIASSFEAPVIDEPLAYWITGFGCVFFAWLIVISFERRRPLTFFFYGLLFPTFASALLLYGIKGWLK